MEPYVSLISGLIGALIGAAASVAGVLVQSRAQAKRDRTKEALALALEDWKMRLEIVKERGGKILPLAVFVHYHTKLIQLAEDEALTPEAIRDLSAEQDTLTAAIKEVNEEWKRQRSGATRE